MRRTLLSAAAGASIALATAPAAQAVDLQDAAEQRLETRSVALLNAATRAMRTADPGCVQSFDHATTVTHDAPSQAMRDAFSLLRRPSIPEDRRFADRHPLSLLGAKGVYVDWIRMARAADGSEHYLVIAQDRGLSAPLPRSCLRLRHRLLLERLDGAPERLRTRTLRMEARLNREEQPAGGFPRREAIYHFSGGSGGGGVDLGFFHRHGLFDTAQRGSDDISKVSGFVPDGVRTIAATFAPRVSRGPHRPAVVYESEVQITVPVQDNVVSFTVERPAEDAFPTSMTWLAADGSVVRVVRGRG